MRWRTHRQGHVWKAGEGRPIFTVEPEGRDSMVTHGDDNAFVRVYCDSDTPAGWSPVKVAALIRDLLNTVPLSEVKE